MPKLLQRPINWRIWIPIAVLTLAAVNCTLTYWFTMMPPPSEGQLLIYWPWLLTQQGPLAAWLFAGLLVAAGVYYAERRRHLAGTNRQGAVWVVIGAVLVAAVPIFFGFGLGITGRYGHLSSITSTTRRYYLGYTHEDFLGDFVICGCGPLGWGCRCHYINYLSFNQFQDTVDDLHLVPTGDGGLKFFIHNELAFTWPDDPP